ncbi:uncharacterized protein KD926_011375 [Aspergillus affinis]|uniref:uncharacterized protein n=1 Tax=Aspergillus affinis TaxID=1070780 RepID=UPI0022FDB875|nr:uncharacterized protein KD926_011375 [Aspergillus affinis]KAI9038037.1 hypothetical protein KD926_011375 [Aspergillus affinis]
MSGLTPRILEEVFNHIVLPPRLPDHSDKDVDQVNRGIIHYAIEAVEALFSLAGDEYQSAWELIKRSLHRCSSIHEYGHVDRCNLMDAFGAIEDRTALILHVTEQNAGLLILPVHDERDEPKQEVTLECFEASPTSESVLACTGSLECDYPGNAVTIPVDVFRNTSFQESLAAFLEQASEELIERFAAKAKKAGKSVVERRNTATPHLISQMLMSLLEAHGSQNASPVLRKRIRDDVCWNDAYLPWRRSPFYLVIRVCIQRLLYFVYGNQKGRAYYKIFIAMIHACLLRNVTGILPVESCHFLRAKLCRRLSKLETDRRRTSCETYSQLLDVCSSQFSGIIKNATLAMEEEWKRFKDATQRHIPSLPLRADRDDTCLQFPNSYDHLMGILRSPLNKRPFLDPKSIAKRLPELVNPDYQRFSQRYYALHELQHKIQNEWTVPRDKKTSCIQVAHQIDSYLDMVSNLLDNHAEEKSVMMVDLFELWIIMDMNAVRQFPLLEEYSCGFQPELLNVLQLASREDLVRLQMIQQYLTKRENQSRFKSITIFSDPSPDGFSDQYVRHSPDKKRLTKLRQEIEQASQKAQRLKEAELERVNSRYSFLSTQVLLPCTRGIGQNRSLCSHCNAKKQRKKLKISAHEDFLPNGGTVSSLIQQRAILFELAMPPELAAYRDTTWRILSSYGKPEHDTMPKGPPSRGLLREYSSLMPYNQHKKLRFHLASKTKSFLVSHYKGSALPASRSQVILPFGPDLYYYETSKSQWAAELPERVTFAHHFSLDPSILALLNVHGDPKFAASAADRSSYEIMTRQNECPVRLTVHEYTTCQSLLREQATRWLSLVRELGSSNLNFSIEATMHLVSFLALHAGPDSSKGPLRLIHQVFEEAEFCHQLATQTAEILNRISNNCRESFCMDMLLTLILRILNLGPKAAETEGLLLLGQVRRITVTWTQNLRHEIQSGVTTETADRLSMYALLAGLVCKRTFSNPQNGDFGSDSLQIFLAACLTIQENLQDPAQLPPTAQAMLVRDFRMTYSMTPVLRGSIIRNPRNIELAIKAVWPSATSGHRTYNNWDVVSGSNGWIESRIIETDLFQSQIIHYHPIDGHLLVDGRPVGKLPPEYRSSPNVQELFGKEHLLVFPSAMRGMEFTLVAPRSDHIVHFGRSKNEIIVRTHVRGNLLHLVHRDEFGKGAQADLPAPLIIDCFHWLNLKKKEVDIRAKKHMWWFSRRSNWVIDISARQASRRTAHLVDPHGKLFRQVSRIFDGFEDRQNITVTQPLLRTLSVEMKRMDLNFNVNGRGYLVCQQLHAEIDPDQDAGTWYGLQSKIVMRETSNRMQRSVVVPIGDVHYHRHGPHVLVHVMNDGRYGRYSIDSTLGRLKCEPEPLLVYTKSLMHAFTSFPLPDTLTGRTGTEEALSCLKSALSKPWNPVGVSQTAPLISLARLTAKRFYYPEHLKHHQQVLWDKDLTVAIQGDLYRPIIEAVANKLERLRPFALDGCHQLQLEAGGVPYLRDRNHLRRRNLEPGEFHINGLAQPVDRFYYARDKREPSTGRENVYRIVHNLIHRPLNIQATSSLAKFFHQAAWIMGRTGMFNKSSLSEALEVDMIQEWGPLTELCRQYNEGQYGTIFKLAMVAFAENVNMDLLRTLAAICTYSDLRAVRIPVHAEYFDIELKERPSLQFIKNRIQSSSEVSSDTLQQAIEEERVHSSTTLTEFDALFQQEARLFATSILKQWPCERIVCPQIRIKCFDTQSALNTIRRDWGRLFRNFELEGYLDDVQKVLDKHQTDSETAVPGCIDTANMYPVSPRSSAVPKLGDLLSKPGPDDRTRSSSVSGHLWRNKTALLSMADRSNHSTMVKDPCEIQPLKALVDEMKASISKEKQAYAYDLKNSLDAFEGYQAHQGPSVELPSLGRMEGKVSKVQHAVERRLSVLVDSLTKFDVRYKWLSAGQLWPCMTPVTIFQHLRSSSQQHFGPDMKRALLDYGVSITQLQQLLRICDSMKKNDFQRSRDEYENVGHENWKPEDFPDWLLMEIDGNILIRKKQVDVALATILPASRSNSVLQMNMGQGKTSVVMPMALCVLGNGKTLGRLIVPKSLLLQTAQTIQSRLGDLVGREVLHIPFTRKSPVEPAAIKEYQLLHEEILQRSGIILTLPEHFLSFRLSGFQCLSDSKLQSAGAILSTDSWLRRVSRDVIDESDLSLAPKTQLIYPSGSQLSLDGHPYRWRMAHILLGMVEEQLADLERDFPGSIEVVRRPNGGFPLIYILRSDVEEALHRKLVGDLCSGKTNILPLVQPPDQMAVKEFICHAKAEQSVCEDVIQIFNDNPVAFKNLHLLRGLICHDILLLCLKKRWNVQYGLHPARSPIAVPFHAKGVPSEQAEWGHPDVAILLTCLAFYYDGLSADQLHQCLQSLSQSDDPSGEYDRWGAYAPSLPDSLRHWNLISIDDDMQVREIWTYLRYGVIVINYFLDHCVFPVHAKQFSQRLQLSGWDIPMFSTQEAGSKMLTTGFSGTNDDRFLLPLTIKQNDLAALSHTNAEVLSYLLQPRNRSYFVAAHPNGKHLSEEEFIRKLFSMNIRILIDAGAHILELDNQALARKWLEIDHSAPAAVYFDRGSKPWVIDRSYKEVPLLASSFANDLDKCLVFLDEAHTRGTDLKFSPSSRGVLTLSLGQTKDHTVQAAMRLRQLGTSQSVVFVAAPEVHQSILDLRQKSSKDVIDSADVIAWLLEQTCCHQEQLKSLYLAQGYDFCRRINAADENDKFLTNSEHRNALLDTLLQKEEHSLEEIYRPKPKPSTFANGQYMYPQLGKFGLDLDNQRLGHDELSASASTLAFAEVEQERECMLHVEEVREIQRPTRLPHYSFPGLHESIRKFALTGSLEGTTGYDAAFTALRRTTLGRKHRLRIEQRSRLFISDEFTKTILQEENHWREDFLRPVHWILWAPSTSTAMILIPEEAERVLSLIRAHRPSPTHLLVYAAPSAKSMLHFNSLDFYAYPTLPKDHTFPTSLKVELGLLSGRLFFSFDENVEILDYLGQDMVGHKDSVRGDAAQDAMHHGKSTPRDDNFLTFLQEWLSVTRKGSEYSHTPMGYVCQSRLLKSDHPAFSHRPAEIENVPKSPSLQLDAVKDEDDSKDDDDISLD